MGPLETTNFTNTPIHNFRMINDPFVLNIIQNMSKDIKLSADHALFIANEILTLNQHSLRSAAYEPPATKIYSEAQLRSFVLSPLEVTIPLSSVAVERAVKDVTRASAFVGSSELERDGFIQNTIQHRKKHK